MARAGVVWIGAAALAFGLVSAPMTAAAQAGAPSFGECEAAVDEAALRAEVTESARAAMRAAAERVDYRGVVEAGWLAARFDQRFADIVDAKIAILREDRNYLERLLDGNVPSRAEEMATRTAELVFQSPEFERLQSDLQSEIGARLEPLVADAETATQSVASDCVQTFLGARYAQTVRTAFGSNADAARAEGSIGAGSVGTGAAISLAGVVAAMLAVVFRRLVQRIVAAAVRRLAGAIAARLAAWASVVIGAVVLVYELVAGADGVFPVIRDELTSRETKIEIQNGLIEELSAAGPGELDKRAEEIAAEMFERWRGFKASHHAILTLAAAEPRFQAFLAEQPPQRFEALSAVVSAVKAAPPGGDAAVLEALDRGFLARALATPDIARHLEVWGPRGVSVGDLVAWWDAAGPLFERALAYELPSALAPGELDAAKLELVLAIPDAEGARRVASMPEPARSDLLALPTAAAARLATRFPADSLASLFESLRAIDDPSRRQLYLARVVERPGLMRVFEGGGAAGTVAASASPTAAMDVLLDPAPRWSPFAFWSHAQAVMDGSVAPMALVHRYGWWLVAAVGLPLLLGLGFLRWTLGILGLGGRRR